MNSKDVPHPVDPEPIHIHGPHCDHHDPYETTQKQEKIGRNDPCPCGSGKKFKKCCGAT